MRIRIAALGLRLVILAAFAVFFVAPVLWLILAPTKSDNALVTSSPFSFGSFHQVALAWKHLDAFSDHIYRHWIGNTLLYALSATAITLVVSVPAGYGLALGHFPGRKLVLSLTLISMIMPAAALVLPIFLELNALHLIGSVLSVILPFAFFPFGVYLAYIYYATALPPDLLDAARVDGCRRVADVPAHRAAAREAGGRARLLLQLRRRLEQLLPAVRRPRGLEPVPDPGRTVEPAVVDAVVQPGGRRRRPVGQHLPAGTGARDAARGHPRRDRVHAVAAGAGARARRRREAPRKAIDLNTPPNSGPRGRPDAGPTKGPHCEQQVKESESLLEGQPNEAGPTDASMSRLHGSVARIWHLV